VGDLHAGVHAAVGAAGSVDGDRFARYRGKAGLEGILHRTATRLGLPAEEAAAVVLQSYRYSRNA
jgi:hypothetical protein